MSIKELLKKSFVVKKIYFLPRKIRCSKQNKVLEFEKNRRLEGFADERYLRIKDYENKLLGKRCFIVATGPSLTFNDLDLLKDEICFGMNSICKIFDKTAWRPTFYGIQDKYVFDSMKDYICKYKDEFEQIFTTLEIKNSCDFLEKSVVFPHNSMYHKYDMEFFKYYSKFSPNSYAMVYDGYSITYSLIQIAVYMGFKEIYLLGADCNYTKSGNNHFVESGFVDKNAFRNYEKMITGYNEAKKYADENGIKIFNATRGGKLEVFQRVKLEDVVR